MENQQQKAPTKNGKNLTLSLIAIIASLLAAYFLSDVGPAPQQFKVDDAVLFRIDSLEKENEILKIDNTRLDSLLAEDRLTINDLDQRLSDLLTDKQGDQTYYHQQVENVITEEDDSVVTFFKDKYNF